jgi:hypothetical protein
MDSRRAWIISAALVLMWKPAVAQFTVADIWSAPGVTGIVDEADQGIHQFNTAGSVSIKSSVRSATLDIRFPVQTMPSHDAPQGSCTEMRAVLRDTGAGTRVVVRLIRLGITAGLEGKKTSVGGIDSDTSRRWSRLDQPLEYGQYRACLNVPAARPFEFDLYTYYVEAQLVKTAAGGNPGPGLMAVQICHTDGQCEP